ncbi:PAS domain S-box-containing protein [Thermoactinomyces sp. DSM 45891]|uniref:sigma-54 interaction domain-containing protein n=1 Tax=Thermoactinomyces sp. DSM 45891 TaxID=1761907 RepID=UPI00091A451A|nr:sigma-54-dependent Fis family transcriptional regulator [Thermoactinomyces sp. DSM 45891]SFX04518.1 PAS domain S-box-containing protein [Thermoactinomyces sp. DSM 45891]
MQKVLIVGGGKGGAALLRTLSDVEFIEVIGIVDLLPHTPAIVEAKRRGIATGSDLNSFLELTPDVVIEVTGDVAVYDQIHSLKSKKTLLVSGDIANLMVRLVEEKESWFQAWIQRQKELEAIIDSTHDGMIAVNAQGQITILNASAEKMLKVHRTELIGKPLREVVGHTRLEEVLRTGESELNQTFQLPSGTEIVTNRVPVKNHEGKVMGAVAVFREVSELQHFIQKIMDLEDMKSYLQAIIDSSDDAISVVDVNGTGLLINPAYTRLTGLQPEEVIGKPAEVDISEGAESMHMKVLRTRQVVRGVQMEVGPHHRDVIVNVAPIILQGELKGSVAIVHDTSELKQLTQDLERARSIIRKLEAKYTFDDIIGESEQMQIAMQLAKQAADTRATVLLRGESGTGKELFAHAIHNASNRKYNQFIRVNCAALSESLLESELFGYEEGAFTGAKRGGKKGLFEEASGGTIFLDEIGELQPSIQAKLLRVLQEREVIRVGGTKSIPIDVRVIAATNVFLERAMEEKNFREDLFFRLNVFPIMIPPLRQRDGDLDLLAIHLIRKFNQEYGRNVRTIAPEAIQLLSQYSFPGNVRELENFLGRAMIHMTVQEQALAPEHLPKFEFQQNEVHDVIREEEQADDLKRPLKDYLVDAENRYVTQIYYACGQNKTRTAKQLGISIRSLYYKLERARIT